MYSFYYTYCLKKVNLTFITVLLSLPIIKSSTDGQGEGLTCTCKLKSFFFFISEMAESPGSIVRDGYLTSTSSPTSSGEDKLSGSDLGDTNGI